MWPTEQKDWHCAMAWPVMHSVASRGKNSVEASINKNHQHITKVCKAQHPRPGCCIDTRHSTLVTALHLSILKVSWRFQTVASVSVVLLLRKRRKTITIVAGLEAGRDSKTQVWYRPISTRRTSQKPVRNLSETSFWNLRQPVKQIRN